MRLLAVFVFGFLVRAAIILANPIIWGGDTIIRLFDRHTLVKGHQLPLLQMLISGVSLISMRPALVQYMMAVIGAAAGVAFYLVVEHLAGERWALPAALLFVTHPYILAVSTVPFQEILMLAGVLFTFHFFYTERWIAASVCLAAACLTRYEAWAACPVLAAAYVWKKERSPWGMCKAAVLFGWMPLVWLAWRHGLASGGHYVIDRSISLVRLQRYAYLGWITLKFTQLPVLVLAAAGAWRLIRSKKDWRVSIQAVFLALFAASILLSAHGVPPDPERYVTSREAHLFMYGVLLLAAFGLAVWPRQERAIVAAAMVLGVATAFWYVHVESSAEDAQQDYRVAQYLDAHVRGSERVLILAPPIPAGMLRLYLDKARETGGDEGLRQAQAEIDAVAGTPPDYQRIVVQSRLDRARFLSRPEGCADWVVEWKPAPVVSRNICGE